MSSATLPTENEPVEASLETSRRHPRSSKGTSNPSVGYLYPAINVRVAWMCLAAAMVAIALAHPAITSRGLSSEPLRGLAIAATIALVGIISIRSGRVIARIERELKRIGLGGSPQEVSANRLLATDPIAGAWNRMVDRWEGPGDCETGSPSADLRSSHAITLARAMRGLPAAWIISDAEGWIRYISPVAAKMLGIDSDTIVDHMLPEPVHLIRTLETTIRGENEPVDGAIASRGAPAAEGPRDATENECTESLVRSLLSASRVVRHRISIRRGDQTTHVQIVRTRLDGRSADRADHGSSGMPPRAANGIVGSTASRGGDPEAMAWVLSDISSRVAAEAGRDAFLLSAAHELRAPLQNLRAAAETIGTTQDMDAGARGEFCNLIISESIRMNALVDDLLAVGQMEAGSMTIRRLPLKLAGMIESAIESQSAAATSKQIHIAADVPPKLPEIQGDRSKLQATMNNLLANAVKYTPSGGNVQMSCTVTGTSIELRFIDDGIGVPEEEHERIFDKFYRASNLGDLSDSDLSAVAGNGLGLAFARQVARLHGGDIALQSDETGGSTFLLSLPIHTGLRETDGQRAL